LPDLRQALEPMVASLDDAPNPELADFTRRLIVSAALSVPILLLAMGSMIGLPFRNWIGEQVALWAELNDAPALGAADVGMRWEQVLRSRSSRRALLWFAFGYNALGVPIAAGVPFPLTGWLLSPMIAAAAMALSSVSVIANALG
jgi:cation transport ATPase